MTSQPLDLVLNTYRIVRTIGEGGMGTVYLGVDELSRREVALKMVKFRTDASADERARAESRLLSEGRALARIDHPNVATLHHMAAEADRLVLAMEYIPGVTYSEWVSRVDNWGALRPVLEQIGAGLQAAHERNVLHRDLKPSNVLITPEGQVRLVDFGLAKAYDRAFDRWDQSRVSTARGSIVGTPAFMAPEQLAGADAGPATDQFALATMIYRTVYGDLPFGGTNDLRARHSRMLEGDLAFGDPGFDVPDALRSCLRRALSFSSRSRFATIQQFVESLPEADGMAPPVDGQFTVQVPDAHTTKVTGPPDHMVASTIRGRGPVLATRTLNGPAPSSDTSVPSKANGWVGWVAIVVAIVVLGVIAYIGLT